MREIALHMADIAENSLAAGAARIRLSVMIDRAADRLTTAIEDNGRGMDADTLYRCTDPFMTTRTARRVGLGLALYKLSAEQSGGSFTIRSEQGRGTRAEAAYIISGIDRAPLGSIADTMAALIAANPETDFTLEYAADGTADGIVINPAAYTHTSVAILDALKAVNLPAVEVHISDVNSREAFRHVSYAGMACIATYAGYGFEGYKMAIERLAGAK